MFFVHTFYDVGYIYLKKNITVNVKCKNGALNDWMSSSIGYWRDNMKILNLPIDSSSVSMPISIFMASSIGRISVWKVLEIREKQMHPQRVTVCGVVFGLEESLDLLFDENEGGQAQTVNGVRYRIEMVSSFFWTWIEEINVEAMWFQKGGATC